MPISCISVPTGDRPEMLARCLSSLLETFEQMASTPALVVADSSKSQTSADRCRKHLLSIAQNSQTAITYIGLEERRTFIERVEKSGAASPNSIRFAIGESFSEDYGSNRNAILLATLGEVVLSTDDDTLPGYARAMGLIDTLPKYVSSATRHMSTWYFESLAESTSSGWRSNESSVSIHNQYIGKSAGELPTTQYAESVHNGPDSTIEKQPNDWCIAVCTLGVAGDCGLITNRAYLLESDEASRARLMRSRPSYLTLAKSRFVVRHPREVLIAPVTDFMSMSYSFDNRVPLPPFMPRFRGEDAVFGRMLSRSSARYRMAHLPYAVVHAPAESRQFQVDLFQPMFWHLVDAILESEGSDDLCEGSLTMAADHLASVCRASLPALKALISGIYRHRLKRISEQIATLLFSKRFEPDYWRTDLLGQLQDLEDMLRSTKEFAPIEFCDGGGNCDFSVLRDELLKLSRMYGEWQSILDAASYLQQRGQGLGREL